MNDDTNGLLSSYANGHAKAGRDACVADAINYSDAETYFDEVARFSIVGKMDQCGSLATTRASSSLQKREPAARQLLRNSESHPTSPLSMKTRA